MRAAAPARTRRPPAATPWAARFSAGQLAAGAAVLLVLVVSVVRFGGPLFTLDPGYTDHPRHEYAAWAYPQIGADIWRQPLEAWDAEARYPHETWEAQPHAYPPGSLVLFLPFGAAANLGLVPDVAVHAAMVVLFGAAAIVGAVLLWRALRPSYPQALAVVMVVLAAAELVHWGLNGFFDSVGAAAALAGIVLLHRGRSGGALALLALALSLHYRLWFLAPLLLVAVWRHRRLDLPFVTAAVLMATSFGAGLLLLPAWDRLPLAGGFVPNPLHDHPVAVAAGAVLVAVVWWAERDLAVTATTALAAAFAITSLQWQSWYGVAFIPLLPLARRPAGQAALCLAWLALTAQGAGVLDPLAVLRQYVAAVA